MYIITVLNFLIIRYCLCSDCMFNRNCFFSHEMVQLEKMYMRQNTV